MDTNLLKELSNADSIASNESETRNILHNHMKQYSNNVFTDNLGSIIFEKKGTAENPKIMIAAHMDEVGFKVRAITKQGQIIVKTIGGVKPLAKFMQTVRITTNTGKKIKGYLQSTYTQELPAKEIPGQTYIDIGATSDKEARQLGIEEGNMVCYDSQFTHLNKQNAVMGKAFDDRLGCYIMAKILENLQKTNHPNTVYFAATSSEEVGTRGAKTATAKIKPDLAFAIDCCCYKDEFDRGHNNARQIGKGMILILSDRGLEPNPELVSIVKKAAAKLKKNLQRDMFDRGGTDASSIHLTGEGVPSVVTCIPLRYGHCSNSIASMDDINDTIEIYTEIIKQLNKNCVDKCKFNIY